MLLQDNTPGFYVHEERAVHTCCTRLLTCIDIREFLDGNIKTNEEVSIEKVNDIYNEYSVCDFQPEPIMLFYESEKNNKLIDAVNGIKNNKNLVYLLEENDKADLVWKVDDNENIKIISECLKEIDTLYVADGHHRLNAFKNIYLERCVKCHNRKYTNYFFSSLVSMKEIRTSCFMKSYYPHKKVKLSLVLSILENYFNIKKISDFTYPETMDTVTFCYKNSYFLCRLKNTIYLNNSISIVETLQTITQKIAIATGDTIKENDGIFLGGEKLKKIFYDGCEERDEMFFICVSPKVKEIKYVSDNKKVLSKKSVYFEPKFKNGFLIYFNKYRFTI